MKQFKKNQKGPKTKSDNLLVTKNIFNLQFFHNVQKSGLVDYQG